MAKVRIYDLAAELKVSPKEILTMLSSIGVANKVASSSVEATAAQGVRQLVSNKSGAPSTSSSGAPSPAPAPTPTATETVVAAPPSVPAPVATASTTPVNSTALPISAPPVAAPPVAPPRAPMPVANPRQEARVEHQNRQSQNNTGGSGYAGNNPRPAGSGYAGNNPRPAGSGYAGNNPRPAGSGYAGNNPRPAGSGYAGNNPRPAGSGYAGNNPRPAGTGSASGAGGPSRGPANRGPRPAAKAAPQDISNSQFATGGRDRKNARRGKFNQKRGRSFDEFEAAEEAPLTPDQMVITVADTITVEEIAAKMRKPVAEVIKTLMTSMNIMRSGNQPLEMDVAANLAARFGFTVERAATIAEASVIAEENPDELITVPPVVVVMGHVDHGKTSLLDRIRKANIQSGEAGGITQRIGAYEAFHDGKRMVFLDTPGHEAFTRMRARGAHVTDIAILVVAADDGIMPQTREAIDHAKAAKVPIIVALNKMDRPDADPDRVLGQLAEAELVPISYGGDVEVIYVSAKTGMGVEDLLDTVMIQAELLDLKANPGGLSTGTVIEAKQDTHLGSVATVLLHRGTLEVGDHIVIGDKHGRVRAMLDYRGQPLQLAGPKTPVFITGLDGVPSASDSMREYATPQEAREAAQEFAANSREARGNATMRTLADLADKIRLGGMQELPVIIKADGQGSVEAIASSLEKLAHKEVRVKIRSRSVGNVTENDVNLAIGAKEKENDDAIIIAFGVNVDNQARQLADREGIEIRQYDVIYAAIDEIKTALEGMLKPIFEEKYSGEAEVRATFKSTKAGTIAGCLVLDGKMVKDGILRVYRGKKMVYEGKIDSLRHYKDEVKEMGMGSECGISPRGYNDLQEGDRLKCFVMEQIERKLEL